ncbi:nuclear transport factor 2 family protein [Acidicapsa dinghuensis]
MGKIESTPHLRLTLAAASLIHQLRSCPLIALILLFSTLPVLAQNIDTADVIVAQENAFWKAYTAGNITDLGTLLQPGFTNVEQEIWTRDQVLTFVQQFHKQCSLAPVILVDPHVSFLTPDIATIIYHANEAATCGARTMSGDTNISTVWVRRDGHWQMHLHSEYAIPAK